MPMPEVQEYTSNANPLDWFGDDTVEVLPAVPSADIGDGAGDLRGSSGRTEDVKEPKSDSMTVAPPLPSVDTAPTAAPKLQRPRSIGTRSIKSVKPTKAKGGKIMPFKMKGKIKTSTPKAKGLTLREAKAQEKLISGMEKGWKKPKKGPEW